MGIPMGLQYSITAIGSVILQAAVNTLGSDAVAAVTAASKISMFFCTPFDAMGNTMATYGGQNTGAFKLSRLKSGVKACMKIGFFYSIAAFIVLYFLGKPMGLLFIDSSEIEILDEIRIFLIINAAFYFPLAIVNIVRFMIQGMGFSRFAILAGIFELVGRAVAAMLLVPFFGFNAVCFASPIAWILADGFLLPAFFYCYKKLERIQCFQRNDFIQTHSGNKR
jgi:Na+-driven multidrug efflux pump